MLFKHTISLIRFSRKFGFFNGAIIYIKLYLLRSRSISLPGLQHPVYLRPRTSDIEVFNQTFFNEQYDIKFKQEPRIIIDGGANIGFFALAIKKVYPEAMIVCIEPDPENFETLKQNVSPYPNILCENAGIWNKETKLRVYDKNDYGKWAMVVEEDISQGNINATTISSLMKKHNIDRVDVLKLDIETSEKQLFAENYESWIGKVKMFVIELHDCDEEGCSRSFFTAINKSLTNYTYSISGENTIIINNNID
jgi:FkbM family methyltransferase